MKVEIKRSNLLRAVKTARSMINTKAVMASARDVLIDAHAEDGIKVTAFDGRTALELPIEGTVHDAGVISAPIERLYKLLHASSAEEAVIRSTKGKDTIPRGDIGEGESVEVTRAELKLGRGKYKLAGLAPDTWPAMPEIDKDAPSLSISGKSLTDMGAIGKRCLGDDGRFAFECAHVICDERDDSLIKSVTTDGRRMVMLTRTADLRGVLKMSFLVEPWICETFGKEIAGDEERAVVQVAENHLAFNADKGRVIVGRVAGNFPPVHKVIDKTPVFVVTFDRAELLEAIATAAAMFDKGNAEQPIVEIDVSQPSGKQAEISFEGATGAADVTVEMTTAAIEKKEKGHPRRNRVESFDSKLLVDILKTTDDEETSFGFLAEAHSQLKIETSSATWIVMPIRPEPSQ